LKRRLVTLWAWLTLLPTIGFLPQTSHIFDIFPSQDAADRASKGAGAYECPNKQKSIPAFCFDVKDFYSSAASAASSTSISCRQRAMYCSAR
jgi:hypothetical protein